MRTKNLKNSELSYLRAKIKEKTGFESKGNVSLMQAFTRSSYAKQWGIESNEVLELIGDQVLSYVTVKLISKRFGAQNVHGEYQFRVRENRLSAFKQQLLSNDNLAQIIDEWNVMDYLIVGKSDENNNVAEQVKVKADTLEAIVGYIAIRSNYDDEILTKAVSMILSLDEKMEELIEKEYRPAAFTIENAITTLKELAEKQRCSMPEYDDTSADKLGYDKNGNPVCCCRCSCVDEKTGYGRLVFSSSKKKAKAASAYLVLCAMFELQNEYGENSNSPIWYYYDSKLTKQKPEFYPDYM